MVLGTSKYLTTIIYISTEVFQQAFSYLASNSSKKLQLHVGLRSTKSQEYTTYLRTR